MKRLLVIATFFGFLMAIYGYILWYTKVQKPLDEILQNELKKGRV